MKLGVIILFLLNTRNILRFLVRKKAKTKTRYSSLIATSNNVL